MCFVLPPGFPGASIIVDLLGKEGNLLLTTPVSVFRPDIREVLAGQNTGLSGDEPAASPATASGGNMQDPTGDRLTSAPAGRELFM